MKLWPQLYRAIQLAIGIWVESRVGDKLETILSKDVAAAIDPVASLIATAILVLICTDGLLIPPRLVMTWHKVDDSRDIQGADLVIEHKDGRGEVRELHATIRGGSVLALFVRRAIMRNGSKVTFWLEPHCARFMPEYGGSSPDGKKMILPIRPVRGGREAKVCWAAFRIDPFEAASEELPDCHYDIEVSGKFAWLAKVRLTTSNIKRVSLVRR